MFDSEIEEKSLKIDSGISSSKNTKNARSSERKSSMRKSAQSKSENEISKQMSTKSSLDKTLQFRRAVI